MQTTNFVSKLWSLETVSGEVETGFLPESGWWYINYRRNPVSEIDFTLIICSLCPDKPIGNVDRTWLGGFGLYYKSCWNPETLRCYTHQVSTREKRTTNSHTPRTIYPPTGGELLAPSQNKWDYSSTTAIRSFFSSLPCRQTSPKLLYHISWFPPDFDRCASAR